MENCSTHLVEAPKMWNYGSGVITVIGVGIEVKSFKYLLSRLQRPLECRLNLTMPARVYAEGLNLVFFNLCAVFKAIFLG